MASDSCQVCGRVRARLPEISRDVLGRLYGGPSWRCIYDWWNDPELSVEEIDREKRMVSRMDRSLAKALESLCATCIKQFSHCGLRKVATLAELNSFIERRRLLAEERALVGLPNARCSGRTKYGGNDCPRWASGFDTNGRPACHLHGGPQQQLGQARYQRKVAREAARRACVSVDEATAIIAAVYELGLIQPGELA
jgi:hypothetical protein